MPFYTYFNDTIREYPRNCNSFWGPVYHFNIISYFCRRFFNNWRTVSIGHLGKNKKIAFILELPGIWLRIRNLSKNVHHKFSCFDNFFYNKFILLVLRVLVYYRKLKHVLYTFFQTIHQYRLLPSHLWNISQLSPGR